FSDIRDQLDGVEAEFGNLKCGCHPNCGIGTMLVVNQRTKEAVPFPQILDTDQLIEDIKLITDSCRSKTLTVAQFSLAVLRNTRFAELPDGLSLWEMLKIIDGHNGARLGVAKKARYDWR